MKINGRLLNFNKIILGEHVIPSSCSLSFPEKMPLVWDFNMRSIEGIIGYAVVYRDDKGLILHATLNNNIPKEILEVSGLGGYFNKIKTHINDEGIRVIDSANLVYCSITPTPADKECTFTIEKGDEDVT